MDQTPAPATPTEYRLFSVWRLLAALLVMGYHYMHYSPDAAVVVPWFEKMTPLLDMFFVLSGFLIFERYGQRRFTPATYGRFLSRRLARLYPLHLATLGFFVAVGIAVRLGYVPSHGGTERYDFSQLLPNLLLMQAWGLSGALTFNYVSWSVSAEWFAYLAFPLLAFSTRRGGTGGLVLLLGVIVAGLEWTNLSAETTRDTWQDAKAWGAYRVLADFTFGALVSRVAAVHAPRFATTGLAWLLLALSIVMMHAGFSFYPVLATIGAAVYAGAVGEKRAPESTAWLAPLMPVAAVSFGIYLWHPVIETVFIGAFWRFVVEPAGLIGFNAYIVTPMAISVFVAMMSSGLIEQPAGRWLAGVFGGAGATAKSTVA